MTSTPSTTDPVLPPEYQWTPRLPLGDEAGASAEAQEAIGRYKAQHKAINNTVRQVLAVPPAVDLLNALSTIHGAVTQVEKPVHEAVRLRASMASQCQYCTAWHRRYAEVTGFSDAEVDAICDLSQPRPAGLAPDVALAVALAHEMSTGALSSDTFAEAQARWGERGVLELIAAAAAQNATSRLAAALKTPLEGAYARLLARKREAAAQSQKA
ncbi:MAG: hypothetical protein GEEBNDBF_02077 [bacterium]|nr:hypothetical protein [bacterium]